MKNAAALILLSIVNAAPAVAATASAQLVGIEANPAPGAAIPASLAFTDETGLIRSLGSAMGGTPAVLVFADYTCTNLCGPILAFAGAALEESGLVPGKDFHLVVIGIDPKDGIQQARAMKTSHIGASSPLAEATTVLIGAPDAVYDATAAAGYHYVYDAEHDQFAHPAAAYVLTRDGRIARVLSGLALNGADLRLALIAAGHGRVGALIDRITLRCFGFDPARGIYTSSISRWLAFGGAGTMLVLIGGIAFMAVGMQRRTRL